MSDPTNKPKKSRRPFFLIVFLLLVVGGGVFGYFYYTTQPEPAADPVKNLREYITKESSFGKMDAKYQNDPNTLLAVPPKDGLLKVETLTFCVVGDKLEEYKKSWRPFLDHLQKATGLKVEYYIVKSNVAPPKDEQPDGKDDPKMPPIDPKKGGKEAVPEIIETNPTTDQQMSLLREGKLHITAFNTGRVQAAVNTAGFIPLFCPANEKGEYVYQMEMIVPSGSSIQKIEDLSGKTIALTSLSSNSGGKAPLVALKEKNLLPGANYQFIFTGGHEVSIRELALGSKSFDVACVANDMLATAVAKGTIKPDQYRSIHKSQSFPPICFGVPHNLDPTLRAKIEDAFKSFSFTGENASVGDYGKRGVTKFVAVNYKNDWEYVREIDRKLADLLPK